jgi:hypothetical protein
MSKNDRGYALALGMTAFLVFLPGAFWGIPDGKSINGALQILDGRIPYRDFWTMYAPGMFYLTAAVFGVFGMEVVYQGIVAVLIKAALVATVFLLVRILGASRITGSFIAAVFTGAIWTFAPEILSYDTALLFLLVSLLLVARYYREGKPHYLVWGGVFAGLAALFKHDVAAYVMLAIIIGLFLSWHLAHDRRPKHWMNPWPAVVRLAAGAQVFFLPVAAWILWKAGFDAVQDLIVFPATDFPKVRGEGLGPLLPPWHPWAGWIQDPTSLWHARAAVGSLSNWTLCRFPQLVMVVGGLVLWRWQSRLSPFNSALGVTFLAAIPFFWTAANVQQNTHLNSMGLFSFLLGSVLWIAITQTVSENRYRLAKSILGAGAAAYAAALVTPFVLGVGEVAVEWPGSQVLSLSGVRGIRIPARHYEVYVPITKFLREHTEQGEYIYVGVKRHEIIVINDPRFYYLSQRLSCCRYSELHPGITDRMPQQQEIIQDMERHDVRALVIWNFGWSDSLMNQLLAEKVAAVPGTDETLLNSYIEEHFRPLKQFGEYVLLWRRDLTRPSLP